jgi:1,2-dihydroxy-3-keto-5-methylthiopentene dioxygenase
MRAYVLSEESRTLAPGDLQAFDVFYERLPEDEQERAAVIARLKQERGYAGEDTVMLAGEQPQYAEMCAKFEREHSHELDEVRAVLDGDGIFDVRDMADQWVRIEVGAGDLIVIPAGKQHRFLMTSRRFIRCLRLFTDDSGWTPLYRV